MTRFKPSFSISVGGLSLGDLESMVKRSASLSYSSRELARESGFRPSMAQEEVNFIVLSPRDLGFVVWPTTSDILEPSFLTRWSRRSLDDQLVCLCAPEDAYFLRAHYVYQPNQESLAIAMTPLVVNKKGDVAVFHIDNYPRGNWLYARFAMPTSRHDLDDKWIFRLENDL